MTRTTKTPARKARTTNAARKNPPANFSVVDAAKFASDGLRAQGRMESAQVARDKAAIAFGDMLKTHRLTTDDFRGKARDGSRPEGKHCAALRAEVAATWLSAAERRVVETANDKANGSPYHKAMTKVANAVNRFLDHVDRMAKAEAEAKANGDKSKASPGGRKVKSMSEVLTEGFGTMLKRLGNDKTKTEPSGANHDAVRKVLEKALKDALAEMAK